MGTQQQQDSLIHMGDKRKRQNEEGKREPLGEIHNRINQRAWGNITMKITKTIGQQNIVKEEEEEDYNNLMNLENIILNKNNMIGVGGRKRRRQHHEKRQEEEMEKEEMDNKRPMKKRKQIGLQINTFQEENRREERMMWETPITRKQQGESHQDRTEENENEEENRDQDSMMMMNIDNSPVPFMDSKPIPRLRQDLLDNMHSGLQLERRDMARQSHAIETLMQLEQGRHYIKHCRPRLLQWIIEYQYGMMQYGETPCSHHNIAATMDYFDRYLAANPETPLADYNFFFIVCFLLSCKFEELPCNKPPTLEKMNYYAMTNYSLQTYNEAERHVLQTLDYRLQTTSVYEFTEELLQLATYRSQREYTPQAKAKWVPRNRADIRAYAGMKVQHPDMFKDVPASHMAAAAILAGEWKEAELDARNDNQAIQRWQVVEHWLTFLMRELGWTTINHTILMNLAKQMMTLQR